MTRKLAILCILLVVLAAPATPFWGAFSPASARRSARPSASRRWAADFPA